MSKSKPESSEKISSVCSNCGNERLVPEKFLGKKIKCKECGEAYRISAVEAEDGAEVEDTPKKEKKVKARKSASAKADSGDMLRKYENEINPDALMGDFKGRGVIGIFLFTIVAHVIVLAGSSFPYIQSEFLNADPIELAEDEKKGLALDEATKAIRGIADKYGLSSSDITSKFSKSGSRGDKVKDKKADKDKKPNTDDTKTANTQATTKADPTKDAAKDKKDDKSKFQKDLEKSEDGPDNFDFKEDEDF